MKTPIGRPALVKLFSSVLWREGDKYFLVTPVEKIGITVDDAPFTAVEMEVEGKGAARTLDFRTNVDEWVTCGGMHALRFEPEAETGGLKPYLHVRRDLWALVTRALFYDLVELGEERDVDGRRMFGVASGAEFYAMAPASDAEGIGMNVFSPLMPAKAGIQSLAKALGPRFAGTSGAKRVDGRIQAAHRRPRLLRSRAARAHPRRAARAHRPLITDFARGDLDLDPAKLGEGRRHARRAPPPCSFRWSITPSRACCSPRAPPTCRATPTRSRFPAARSIRPTRRRSPPRCARRDEEIGLDAALIEPIGYLDLYLTFTGFRILPVLARVIPNYATAHQRVRSRRRLRGAARRS